MWSPLAKDDFKGHYIDPKWSPFDMLLEIAKVEDQKFEQDERSSHKKIHVGVGVTAKPNSKKAEPNPVGVDVAVAVSEASIPKDPTTMWYESLFARIGETLRKNKEGNTGKKPSRDQKFNNASKKNIYDHVGITIKADSKNSEPNPVAETSKPEGFLPNRKERSLSLKKKPITTGWELMNADIEETLRNTNLDNTAKKPLVLKLGKSVDSTPKSKSETQLLDDDEERVSNSKKPKNKSKPTSDSKLNRQSELPNPPPALAEEFRKKICEMGGTEVTFIFQRALFSTDLCQHHNRLSMPVKQIKTEAFLRESELQLLVKKDSMTVPLLQPCSLEVWENDIIFSRRDMPKPNNPSTSMYVLRGSWFYMAKANNLKENDVVQVWSFRVQGQLWMALVKVEIQEQC